MSVTTETPTVVHRFYEECLNQRNSGILAELFTANVVAHTPNGDSTGLAALEKTVESVHAMFPDHHFVVEDFVIQGDKGAARWTMTATNSAPIGGIPPTGKPITQRANVFYRFEEGRVAELWLQLDQIGVLRQIGVPLPVAPQNR